MIKWTVIVAALMAIGQGMTFSDPVNLTDKFGNEMRLANVTYDLSPEDKQLVTQELNALTSMFKDAQFHTQIIGLPVEGRKMARIAIYNESLSQIGMLNDVAQSIIWDWEIHEL